MHHAYTFFLRIRFTHNHDMTMSHRQPSRISIPAQFSRSHVVWASLTLSLSLVGGLLLLLEDQPLPTSQAIQLVDLNPQSGLESIEVIFQGGIEIDDASWRGIVIHHSGSPVGSADSITRQHQERGFAGLGYHFVIGNGQGMGDGELHVGYRWVDQLPGVHVAGPQADVLNRQTIGICLIGDGDRRSFSRQQLASLAQLTGLLCQRLKIDRSQVVLGRDVSPTSGPGRLFPEAAFREQLTSAQ